MISGKAYEISAVSDPEREVDINNTPDSAKCGNAFENSRGGIYTSLLLNTKFAVIPSREVCVIVKVGEGIRLGMREFPSASCTVPISPQHTNTNPSSGIFRDGSTGSM